MTVSKVKAIHRASKNVNRRKKGKKKKNWGEPWLRDGWAMGGYVELTAGQVTISPTTTTTIWPNISPSLSLSGRVFLLFSERYVASNNRHDLVMLTVVCGHSLSTGCHHHHDG